MTVEVFFVVRDRPLLKQIQWRQAPKKESGRLIRRWKCLQQLIALPEYLSGCHQTLLLLFFVFYFSPWCISEDTTRWLYWQHLVSNNNRRILCCGFLDSGGYVRHSEAVVFN